MSAVTATTVTTSKAIKPSISITPQAALKSWELIQTEHNPDLKLRVSILGGGCHGFRYQFSFAETTDIDDTVITQVVSTDKGDISVDWVVGLMSLQLLNGVEIDYKSDLNGERFIIRNLNVKTTCSCGHSFSVMDDDS